MRDFIYRLSQPHAGVCVKQIKNRFVITDETGYPLTGVKIGTKLIELDTEQVTTPDGKKIKATGTFFITAETIQPYHIILDITDKNILQYVGMSERNK